MRSLPSARIAVRKCRALFMLQHPRCAFYRSRAKGANRFRSLQAVEKPNSGLGEAQPERKIRNDFSSDLVRPATPDG